MRTKTLIIILALLVSANIFAATDDTALVKEFLESCYRLPYNPNSDMTDVILVDAYTEDQLQIKGIVTNVFKHFNNSAPDIGWLSEIWASKPLNENVIKKVFRERAVGENYRLETGLFTNNIATFHWDDGEVANKNTFYMISIANPPKSGGGMWSCYDIQGGQITVREGEKRCLCNEGFYLNIFGVPALVRLNATVQTVDAAASKKTMPEPDIADFQYLKIDTNRLKAVLNGTSKFGKWTVIHKTNDSIVGGLSFVSPDGIDHDLLRVYFQGANLDKKYLCYLKEFKSGILDAMYAWDYSESNALTRFLRIERSNKDGKLQCWAQSIGLINKSTNIDMSLFAVNLSNYPSIYDLRPKYPVQTVNGKVVWNAATDGYKNGSQKSARSPWTRVVTIRSMFIFVSIVPLVLVLLASRKMKNRSDKK